MRYGYNRDGTKRKKPQPRPPDPASLPAMEKRMLNAIPFLSISEWLLELEGVFENMATNTPGRVRAYHAEEIELAKKPRQYGMMRFVPSDRYLMPKNKQAHEAMERKYNANYFERESHHVKELRYHDTGIYTSNYHLARKDAAKQLEMAVRAFARRAALKMIGMGCEDPTKVSGEIHYTGRHLIATVHFASSDGKRWLLRCKTKTNYRYGENSINRHMTVYLQYPFKVTEEP